MLKQAHAQGVADALTHLKLAGEEGIGRAISGMANSSRYGEKAKSFLGGVARNFIGQPGRVFQEGGAAFRDGGFLSPKNVFWPPTSGAGGSKLNWINRAGTIMAPLTAMSAMKEHPEEGRLSSALGALGGIAGTAYGYPSLGILGAPLLGRAGAAVGRGVGHLLGSHPKDPYQ